MFASQNITTNKLLNALPPAQFSRLEPHLEPVSLQFRENIYNINDPVDYIYFPESAVISNVNLLEDGQSLETGIISREGMTGFSTVFKRNYSPYETSVQVAGDGLRIKTRDFWEIFDHNGTLPRPVLAFINTYTEQSNQSAACARHHPLAKRMIKRLLMYQDRMPENEKLLMDQESTAVMLGASRGSVVVAANELRAAGLIKYSRGVVKIIDRAGLEASACECYGFIRKSYAHYIAQIESKEINRRIELNSRELENAIEWRRKNSRETEESVNEFRRVRAMGDDITLIVKTCSKCQRLCDLQYNPLVVPEDNKRLLQVLSTAGICTYCLAHS